MTFLPIVERELRVTARRRSTYWTRLLVGLFAILTGSVIFVGNFNSPPQIVGQSIFFGLSVLCLAYGVFSGRIATADCLSEEKREGTLGLLFLTDLKGYDIVLGKLVSTSVGALYGLLAVLPVLALPLLMGGVTNGEFWRVVLVLVNTFLFSLAIGIFGSAISRDARRAMGANLLLLILFLGVLPLGTRTFTFLFGAKPPNTIICSPFYAYYLCEDIRYQANPDAFWESTGIVAALSGLLLALASWLIPRTWQDQPHASSRRKKLAWREFWNALSFGRRAKLGPHRKRMLDVNAFYWLAARARLKPLHVWIFLGLMAGWWIVGWMTSGPLWLDPATSITLAMILGTTLKLWIGVEAGQTLAEDQKGGAMELLLSTPLTSRDILRGQWLALRRQFLGPALLAIAIAFILMLTGMRVIYSQRIPLQFWLAGIVMFAVDAITLPVVAMRMALIAKSPARATVGTIGRVLVLPWFLFGLCAGVINLSLWFVSPFSQMPESPGSSTYLALWLGLGIVVDIYFGWGAQRELLRHFRALAIQRHAPEAPRKVRARPRLRLRRKPLLTGALAAVALAAAWLGLHSRAPAFPPAVDVSITKRTTPFQVFPSWATFIIVPDGSLWRWGGGMPGRTLTQATVPARVGTNDDWAQVSVYGYTSVGLRKDGSLWEWKGKWGNFPANPTPVGTNRDWAGVTAGNNHSVALKRNGTVWAWGRNYVNQLGNSGPDTTIPVPVGGDPDWTAILCQEEYTLALKKNGTLWIWGQAWKPNSSKIFATPTLVCRETNWTGLNHGPGMTCWVRNSAGQVWQLTPADADPTFSIVAMADLIASNTVPGRVAAGFFGRPEIFEVRPDGTLWEKVCSLRPWFVAPPTEKWRQMGQRTDWEAVWGGANTTFGLTADGTLWMWGIDPTRAEQLTWGMRWVNFRQKIGRLIGNRPGTGFRVGNGRAPAYQKTPRSILHLVKAPAPSDAPK